jgi:hypothetical protein
MTTGAEHERQLIEAFILPQRRRRYLEFLARPKHRNRIISELSRFKHLDPRSVVCIPPRAQHSENIRALLLSMGAPDLCHALSEDSEIDGKELPLEKALQCVVGRGMGTFLSCVPGKLAYFEDEDQRWILRAKI